jgi:cation:H+ antiporter
MSALIFGAGILIHSSEKIAIKLGISLYIVSATLIAFGTSLPEMAASVFVSLEHHSELAVANVIGSTIFNVAFVLGIVFLLSKDIKLKKDIFKEEGIWIIIPVIFFILLSFDGVIDLFDGIIFLTIMVAFLYNIIKKDNLDEYAESEVDENDLKEFSWIKTILILIVGFIFVIKGADYTIQSSSNIAKSLGVSEWVIGIFLVAFGTSLPELLVGITASIQRKSSMLIGTIIGSNIANFSMVLGLSAIVNPLKFSLENTSYDIMLAIASIIIFLFITISKMYNKAAGIMLLSIIALSINHQIHNMNI